MARRRYRLQPVGYREFRVDVLEMKFHGILRDEDAIGHLSIRNAIGKKQKNLTFAIR